MAVYLVVQQSGSGEEGKDNLVPDHETVVLFEDVVVAPNDRGKLQQIAQVEKDQNGANGQEKGEATPQPPAAALAFFGVQVSAGYGGKTVGFVENNRPDRNQ